jgi:hypothetical protein
VDGDVSKEVNFGSRPPAKSEMQNKLTSGLPMWRGTGSGCALAAAASFADRWRPIDKDRKTTKEDEHLRIKDGPMEDNGKKTSRRDVLKLGAYGLGAIGAMSAASRANAQVATKAQQKVVIYQPKDGKQCAGCQHYEVPSSYRIVEGEISANGYCILFAKKPA